jgi:HSP20 family protein
MTKAVELWSPFRGLERFRHDFDTLVDRFLGGDGEFMATSGSPALESFMEKGELVVRADLPGVDPKDVDVTVSGDTLMIRGKREHRSEEKNRNYFYREVSYGGFERAVTLPEGVKAEEVKASFKSGVLELRMPVPKEAVARKVPIEIESGRKN